MVTEYEKICAICGKPDVEIHHLVFGRGLRELADADSLTIPLCRECHKAVHLNGTASTLSKMLGQAWYEKTVGDRESFRKRYGRSYL